MWIWRWEKIPFNHRSGWDGVSGWSSGLQGKVLD